MSTLDSGGSSSEKGPANPGSPVEGSFILFEDQISADIVTSRGDNLQGGPSVHSLQTGKSDSFRGTQSSDAVDSYLGWIQKVSTTELLSPIASRGQTRQETLDTLTNQETSSGQIMYIEQPEFRQRLRPERPGFKSPSLRIGSRGRIFRRLSDPSSIPTSQKALPIPASSAARAAPPALVNLQTHRAVPSAIRRRMARRLEQRLEGDVLDTSGLRRILGEVAQEAAKELSGGDLCMRQILRSLGHCDALLYELASCATQARKLPIAIRRLREEAAWRGSSVSLTATRHLLQQAVGLETLHSRLVQSLLKAFTNLGVGTNARCSLGHSMDRVPLPSLPVGDESPICHRCERTAEELLRAAGQEAPFEPWWKCRGCAAKSRDVFLCTECGRYAQAAAGEALLSKPATKSWNSCMHVLRELLSPDVPSSRVSPCETGDFTEDETLQSALAKESQGIEASMDTSESEMQGLPVRGRPNSAQAYSSKSNDLGREGALDPHVVSEGSEWVEEVLQAAHKPGAVSSASAGSVVQPDEEHPDVAGDGGDGDSAPSASAEAEADAGFHIPATFLTCPDDASVVSNVSLEDASPEPMPEPMPQPRLDLFVKLGDLWTPTPIVRRPKTGPEQPWVLDVPKKPLPECRTITKKLRLPVGPGLEKVLLMGPRAPLGLPSTAGANSRVKEVRAGRRRDQQGFDANCGAKELLRRAQKPPGRAPCTYAVAPQELFDEHVQAMDLPVWQGVVDSWNRRIRAAGESGAGTPDASVGGVLEQAAQSELAVTAAETRPFAPKTIPTSKEADGKYRVFDIAQWVRQSERSKLWVDPDDIMQHYFEEACNVRRRKPQEDVLHD